MKLNVVLEIRRVIVWTKKSTEDQIEEQLTEITETQNCNENYSSKHTDQSQI